MVTDWISTLQEQAELVKRVATDVALKLEHPDISEVQASMLLLDVEQGATMFDRILDEMDDEDVEDELFEAGATIADTWTNLSVMTAKRVRTMQGFGPIPEARQHFETESSTVAAELWRGSSKVRAVPY